MSDFDTFWRAYPRKISKGDARKAFGPAIKKTSLPVMLKAIEDYIANKKPEIDFCYPATWLRGERWDDEWETPKPTAMDMFGDYIDGTRPAKTLIN